MEYLTTQKGSTRIAPGCIHKPIDRNGKRPSADIIHFEDQCIMLGIDGLCTFTEFIRHIGPSRLQSFDLLDKNTKLRPDWETVFDRLGKQWGKNDKKLLVRFDQLTPKEPYIINMTHITSVPYEKGLQTFADIARRHGVIALKDKTPGRVKAFIEDNLLHAREYLQTAQAYRINDKAKWAIIGMTKYLTQEKIALDLVHQHRTMRGPLGSTLPTPVENGTFSFLPPTYEVLDLEGSFKEAERKSGKALSWDFKKKLRTNVKTYLQ